MYINIRATTMYKNIYILQHVSERQKLQQNVSQSAGSQNHNLVQNFCPGIYEREYSLTHDVHDYI